MCLHKHIRSWRRRHFSCSNKQIAFWLIGVVNFVSRQRLNCFIKTLFCTCVLNLNTKQEVNFHFYWYLLTFWFWSVFWSVHGMFTFLILVYVQDGWTPLLFANDSCNPLEPPYWLNHYSTRPSLRFIQASKEGQHWYCVNFSTSCRQHLVKC